MRSMKRTIAFSLLSCALITACGTSQQNVRHGRGRGHRYGGDEAVVTDQTIVEQSQPETTTAPEQRPQATPAPAPEAPQPTPTPAPVVKHEAAKTGIPIPGKPGYVRSPYSPNSGLIDVRGYPTGTEVKDPYTGNIILVP